MKHIFVDGKGGGLVGPGDYDVINTFVRIASVSRSDGHVIDQPQGTVVHHVERKATPSDKPATAAGAHEESRVDELERALADIRAAFDDCFTPDMGGFDWRSDVTVQAFARACGSVLARTAPTKETR